MKDRGCYLTIRLLGFLRLGLVVGVLVGILGGVAGPAAGQDYDRLKSLAIEALKGDSKLGQLVLPILLSGLGLSPEQKLDVQEIIASHRKPLENLFRQLRDANKELAHQLLVANKISLEDVAPHVQRVSRLREEILLEGLTAVLEVREVLTPEQLEKAAALKDQVRALQGAVAGEE